MLGIVVLAVAALSSSARAQSGCQSDLECKHGRVCRSSRCVESFSCTRDTDCPGDDVCTMDRCSPALSRNTPPPPPDAPAPAEAYAATPPPQAPARGIFAAELAVGIGPGLYTQGSNSPYASINPEAFLGLGARLRGDVALMGFLDATVQHFPYFHGSSFTVLGLLPGAALRFGLGQRMRLSVGLGARVWTFDATPGAVPTLYSALFIAIGQSGLGLRISGKLGVELGSYYVPVQGSIAVGLAYAL